MSSLSPAARPVLGALALASLLALTSCGGEQPEQVGTAAAPTASASAVAPAPSGSAPAEGRAPAGERATAAPTAPDGGPAEPTAEPTGAAETAAETTDESAEETTDEAAEGTTGDADGTADGTAGEPARGGGTAGARTDWCATSALEVSAAPAGSGAGSVYVDITVTNAAEEPCVLAGYPGVSFVDADGTALGAPAVRDAAVPGTGRELAPGESATAALRISQAAVHPGCEAREAAGLRVYPPENTQSVVVPFPAEACTGPGVQQLEIQGFGT
ncbi:DUF4232 domain-containing protein [Kocuria sediminis]|uniref:DUF4232 domain-containing protein n=1 Tax=Kocuria sediminis TaxID=1038857 RepID=A0A6N8GFJ8_9MICC|nr:DUF4232 domain-containing protein [Kocuria sediminis]MUN61976.1 DUF4232 domain-containing protein [Kocuria sediminis]